MITIVYADGTRAVLPLGLPVRRARNGHGGCLYARELLKEIRENISTDVFVEYIDAIDIREIDKIATLEANGDQK